VEGNGRGLILGNVLPFAGMD